MATLTTESDKAIDQLNSLLRGEISSVETYRQALDKAGDLADSIKTMLRALSQDHAENAQRLRQEILWLGGDADDSAGIWGAWAKTLEGLAALFGDNASLKVLKEGEEHGLKDYEEALDDLPSSTRTMVLATMIPAQRRHIRTLDDLLSAI